MSYDSKYVVLEGEIEQETDRALLIDFGGLEPVWVPKSQIQDHDADDTEFLIYKWWAKKNGLI